jgi:hypothetical protein
VSTQHHAVFDDHFQTIRDGRPGSLTYKSNWQVLAGLNQNLEGKQKENMKKHKRGGRGARLIAQMLSPILYLGKNASSRGTRSQRAPARGGRRDRRDTTSPDRGATTGGTRRRSNGRPSTKPSTRTNAETLWTSPQTTHLMGALFCRQRGTHHLGFMGRPTSSHQP